jgi:hypothetical protein
LVILFFFLGQPTELTRNPITFFTGHEVPGLFFGVFFATFLWVYGSSMLSIYRIGKEPFMLKPFAEDKTRGLRPFGATALRLIFVYDIPLVVLLASSFISPSPTDPTGATSWILGSGMILGGIILFILPLRSLHQKLRQAKKDDLAWISSQYTQTLESIKQEGIHGSDERLLGELTAIDKLQRDIHQTHTWPFDLGIMARLVSVTFLPLVVTVIGRILILLTLHV